MVSFYQHAKFVSRMLWGGHFEHCQINGHKINSVFKATLFFI